MAMPNFDRPMHIYLVTKMLIESVNVILIDFQVLSISFSESLILFIDDLLEADRVFGEKCPTKQVYEQGIKDVSLSVVRGINCE